MGRSENQYFEHRGGDGLLIKMVCGSFPTSHFHLFQRIGILPASSMTKSGKSRCGRSISIRFSTTHTCRSLHTYSSTSRTRQYADTVCSSIASNPPLSKLTYHWSPIPTRTCFPWLSYNILLSTPLKQLFLTSLSGMICFPGDIIGKNIQNFLLV